MPYSIGDTHSLRVSQQRAREIVDEMDLALEAGWWRAAPVRHEEHKALALDVMALRAEWMRLKTLYEPQEAA